MGESVKKQSIFFVIVILLLYFARAALLPLWIAAGAVYLLDIPISYLERFLPLQRTTARRRMAVMLTILLTGILVSLIGIGLLPQLRQSISTLAVRLPSYCEQLEQRMAALPIKVLPDSDTLWEQIHHLGSGLIPGAWRLTKGLGGALAESLSLGITSAVLFLYFLFSKQTLLAQLDHFSHLLPARILHSLRFIGRNAKEIFSCYLRSRLLESGFLLLCCLPGLLLCRIPYALLFSVLISIGNLIPFLGSLLTTGFCTILLLAIDPMKALWFALFILALQQLDNVVVYPRIADTSLGLPTVWSVTAVVIGARLAGAAGAFLSVPLAALCLRLTDEMLRKRSSIT